MGLRTSATGDGAGAVYKAEKEAFVSDLTGTSMAEINFVLCAMPVSCKMSVVGKFHRIDTPSCQI